MNIWKRYSMRVSKNWVKFNKMFTLSPCMKIPSLFLFVALVLPMTPTLVHAQGAPAMPLVVCHVDQAPQMLVPAYLCQWHGGSQHP